MLMFKNDHSKSIFKLFLWNDRFYDSTKYFSRQYFPPYFLCLTYLLLFSFIFFVYFALDAFRFSTHRNPTHRINCTMEDIGVASPILKSEVSG